MNKRREESDLAEELVAAQSLIGVGTQYWHYKGRDKIYTVLDLGFLEATNELCVVYRAEYGKKLTFIRPLAVWLEHVEWQGESLPRFTKI